MSLKGPSQITNMEDARKHRKYALFVLMIVYAFNFIDRQILNILQTPIKEELGISDTALGLLTGTSFTLVYVFVGIFVARIASELTPTSCRTLTSLPSCSPKSFCWIAHAESLRPRLTAHVYAIAPTMPNRSPFAVSRMPPVR